MSRRGDVCDGEDWQVWRGGRDSEVVGIDGSVTGAGYMRLYL